jgi:murein DD-endopeptidase MepM/ murein hydrolase activator NlpD
MLAIVVSFGLATLAPASSAGDPDPVAARIAQPPIETQRQIGAVAGIAAGSSVDEPQVRHVFRALPADPATLTGYQWPLFNGRITLPFGPWRDGSRVVDGQAFHDGLDLATFCGDRIVAAHDGTVLAAGRHYDSQMGWVGDLGPYLARLDARALWSTLPIVLVIDDGNGYRSIYAHFSKLVVKRGQTVRAGQLVGYEGRTGRASGCHLHYGLFSPLQTGQFGIDPVVAEHMQLPTAEIARIDPLLVLPSRAPSTAAPVTVPHALGAND